MKGIHIPWELGQEVWYKTYKYAENDCELCDGKRQVVVKDKDKLVNCPWCFTSNRKIIYSPIKTTIQRIEYHSEIGSKALINFILRGFGWADTNYVFTTEAECQTACDKINDKPSRIIE